MRGEDLRDTVGHMHEPVEGEERVTHQLPRHVGGDGGRAVE